VNTTDTNTKASHMPDLPEITETTVRTGTLDVEALGIFYR